MIVEAQVTLHGSKAAVWSVITDIAHGAELIRGIERIEIVHTPGQGLVGLRWRETRLLFGKAATVEKWITAATEHEGYTTRAESDGFAFLTTLGITEGADGLVLTSAHESQPQTFLARVQMIPMGLFFRGVIRKAILEDLNDLKAAVEGTTRFPG